MTKRVRRNSLWLVICCCCVSLVQASGRQSRVLSATKETVIRNGYVGDAACAECHKTTTASYIDTAHAHTSEIASSRSILGSFAEGRNILTISAADHSPDEPHLYFEMDAKPDGYYETAIAEQRDRRLTHTERMDVVIGSGVRGQTYLYWKHGESGDQLYELPVSYWTDGNQWINSPGYKDGTANFERRADPRCIECHASYIKALSPDPQMNLYEADSLVTGITCETCHGPGAEHVKLEQKANPSKLNSAAILNPAKISRDLQVDQCALCHNGTARKELGGAFSYIPGQSIDRYFEPEPIAAATPDVHGNQVALLRRSRCFLSSPAMTCSTCHDVHALESPAPAYSTKCLKCHAWQSCGESKRIGHEIVRDCIRCHMPLEETSAIVSVTAGRVLRTSIRTHWIRVYPPA